MKKIIAIVLLVVLVYNLVGFVAVFKALQIQMRANFSTALHNNLSNRRITSIIYSEENKGRFSKLNDKELCYEDRMYDVVSKKNEGGQTVYTCVADDAETELIDTVEALLAKGLDPSHCTGATGQLCMLLLAFYILPDTLSTLLIPGKKQKYAIRSFQTQNSPFIGLHFAPPKMD